MFKDHFQCFLLSCNSNDFREEFSLPKVPEFRFLIRSVFQALFLAVLLPTLLSAQTINIPTSWSSSQIQNAVANAGANTTIRFATGTFYVRQLQVNSNNVTIEGSGNRGTTLDGQYQGGHIILVSNRNDVTIRNLNLKGAEKGTYNGVISAQNANRLVVDNCDIEVERTQGGVFVSGGGGQQIINNTIYNPRAVNFEYAADLLFLRNTNSNGWLIENNTLNAQGKPTKYPTNSETLARAIHVDNIQTIDCQGGTINANTITIDIDIEKHFHGILLEGGSGTYTVTNNYMVNNFVENTYSGSEYASEQLDFILGFQNTTSSKFLVYHNTIVGNGQQLFRYVQLNPASEIKNNIFYRRGNENSQIILVDAGSAMPSMSHNLFYNQRSASSQVAQTNSGNRNTAGLDALTGGSGSRFGDPLFVLEGPDLLSGSPASNSGTPISGIGTDLDGNARDSSPTIGAIEVGGSTVEESASIEGPPIIDDSGNEVFLVDYVTNTQRDIIVDVFDSNWDFKGESRYEDLNGQGSLIADVSYNQIATPTAHVMVSLLQDNGNWQTWVKRGFIFNVEVNSSTPESVTATAPLSMASSGSAEFTVDYVANSQRDILIDIFDANWGWKGKRRIQNVNGSGSWTGSVNFNNITTATSIVKVSLLPDGGTWRDEIENDIIYDVPVGGSVAPDLPLDLWDGIPSAGVTTHNSWGVTGLAPNRHLQFQDVDLSTGYNKFEFEYCSGFAGNLRVEVRLGSVNGQLLGTANFSGTGSWAKSSAQITDADLTPVSGTHDVFIVVKSGYMNAFRCWFIND